VLARGRHAVVAADFSKAFEALAPGKAAQESRTFWAESCCRSQTW